MQSYYSAGCRFTLVLLSIFLQRTCHAFLAPRPTTLLQHHAAVSARTLHASARSMIPPPLQLGFVSSLLTAQEDVDVVAGVDMDQAAAASAAAFSDSIVTFDGTIQTMVIVFGVVVLILAGMKAYSGQMDAAIEEVLVDFEATLKRSYPQRWQDMEEQLTGLGGDERDIELLRIMEELQQKEPAFMTQLTKKMGK
jgi:hypothetical protein